MHNPPRQYAMVKLGQNYRKILSDWLESDNNAPPAGILMYEGFLDEQFFIFAGEIPNQPGHCVVFGKSGTMYPNFHIEDFEELTEDEV